MRDDIWKVKAQMGNHVLPGRLVVTKSLPTLHIIKM